MLLFSIIIGNRLSLFLFVAVLALLQRAMAEPVEYDQGTRVEINSTQNDEGVEIIPSPAPMPMPTTGVLFDGTTVINNNQFVSSDAGIEVSGRGSKLIAYGGIVSSTFGSALYVLAESSAAICDGTFTGGALAGTAFSVVKVEQRSSIEIKNGTFTGGEGFGGAVDGAGLTIDGSGSRGIIIDGIFQGANAVSGEDAGCGLRVVGGSANAEVHGGRFTTGSGLNPCSLLAFDGGTIEVYQGATFDGDWRISNGGTIIVYGQDLDFEGSPLDETGQSTNGRLNGTLCDGTPIDLNVVVGSGSGMIKKGTTPCQDIVTPTIEDCDPSPSAAPSGALPVSSMPSQSPSTVPSQSPSNMPSESPLIRSMPSTFKSSKSLTAKGSKSPKLAKRTKSPTAKGSK